MEKLHQLTHYKCDGDRSNNIIMKLLILVLLATLAFTITDKEIIQQALNGAFEQNKLPDPKTIVPCIDDTSAHQIVVFIGQVLDKAAKGSLSDLLSLPKLIKDFGNTLNPAVGDCLDGNAELDTISVKYNPKNASSDEIEKKVIAYVTLHYLTVHKWLGDLDDTWHAGNYYQVGFKGATYGHNILGLSAEEMTHGYPRLGRPEGRKHSHVMKLLRELQHIRESLNI